MDYEGTVRTHYCSYLFCIQFCIVAGAYLYTLKTVKTAQKETLYYFRPSNAPKEKAGRLFPVSMSNAALLVRGFSSSLDPRFAC